MSSFPANVLPVSSQDFSVGFHSVVFGFFLIHFLSWCLLFSCHLSPPLLSPFPPPLATPKAPGDGRRALTIRLPQTRSTTRTRAPLNTNAPNLPQHPTARGVSRDHGLSRWSLCTRKAAPRTRRTTAARTKPMAGPITALRLRGEENGFLPLGIWLSRLLNESSSCHYFNSFFPAVRLSQDLAKDLAILAREIHGVAGDGDPQDQESSSAPISRVTAHEQVSSSKTLVGSPDKKGRFSFAIPLHRKRKYFCGQRTFCFEYMSKCSRPSQVILSLVQTRFSATVQIPMYQINTASMIKKS